MAPPLRGPRVVLRPAVDSDVPALAAFLAEPAVARWFLVADPRETAAEWIADPGSETFAIELDGEVVGTVQYYEELDPEYRHAGLDIFLGASWHGQGLGPEALAVLARHLFEERGHHRLVIDPAAANERAIRAYASIGFKPVGVMRQYERGADGTWHDGLLMDMLARELVEPP